MNVALAVVALGNHVRGSVPALDFKNTTQRHMAQLSFSLLYHGVFNWQKCESQAV
jgi:hypothetical protein